MDNNLEVLSILLEAGADVNARDNDAVTALIVASTENPEAVSLLLEAGADVNAKTEWGMTALDYARRFHYKDITNVLEEASGEHEVDH